MSAIGARSDKAVGYSTFRIDVGIAGATTTALTLCATVPVAFHCSEVIWGINCRAGYAAVHRIERQTDVDGDVLRRRIVFGGAAIAQHHQTISDRDRRRARGPAGEVVKLRPRRCIGRHDLRIRVLDIATQKFGRQLRTCHRPGVAVVGRAFAVVGGATNDNPLLSSAVVRTNRVLLCIE